VVTEATTHSPVGFQLRVPENWVDFSVADEADENRIAGDVWSQCIRAGLSEQQAGAWTESVRRAIRHARQSGVLHAASVFQIYEDGPFSANLVVSTLTPPEDGDVLGALVQAQGLSQPDGTWQRVGTASIDGIGTVGRIHGIQDVTQDEATMRCAVMHTVVPIPGASDILIVTGSSPNIAESSEVFEMFEAIAATLEFSAE
jgi:hypothetical protein